MKPISKSHQEFIRLVVSGKSQQDAYRISVGKKGIRSNVCDVKGSQLAKRYASDIASAKQKAAKVVEDAHNTKEAQEALKSILTQSQVDAKLCAIIKGEVTEPRYFVIAGKIQIAHAPPSLTDVNKAIDLYNKRFGSNAPTKVEQKNTGEIAITNITRTVISKKV